MGALAQLWEQRASDPFNDRYYSGPEPFYRSMSGVSVTNDAALRLSAVWSCRKILAEGVAQLPLILYQRILDARGKDQGRERVKSALATLLHDEPNNEQGTFEFLELLQGWAVMRSAAYAEKLYDGRGVSQLIPRHPDRVKVERLANGKRRFLYLEDDAHTWRTILDEDMFRVPGTPVLDHARESFGMAIALDTYSSKTWLSGIRPSGFIATDPAVKYNDSAREKLRAAIEENHGGAANAGKVLFLPEGLKWNQLGMTNEQAEFVASKTFAITDIARWFRIPPYMLGVLEAGTVSYASVEMQSIEFVVYCLMPWLKRWESAIRRDLIVEQDTQFVEFLLAGLLRGTTSERYAAYAIARQWGWLSVNDIRRLENLNPIEGGDIYDRPLNMVPAGEAGSPAARLARLLASDTAGRVVRREVAAMSKASEKHEPGSPEWRKAVEEFYAAQPAHLISSMPGIQPDAAASFARTQRDRLLADGPSVLADWETTRVNDLANLVLEAA